MAVYGPATINANTVTGVTSYDNGIIVGAAAGQTVTVTNNLLSGSGPESWALSVDSTPATATVVLGGNVYAGTWNKYIVLDYYDFSAVNIDATGEIFGATYNAGTGAFTGGILASTGTLSQQYAFANKIIDGVDASGMGLVRTEANNVYVTPNSYSGDVGTYSPSIQRAINVASPGDTVNVAAGSYVGDLTIGQSLTLSGAEAGVDPARNRLAAAPESTIVGAGNNAPIAISSGADNVTIDGFTIESPSTGSGQLYSGIWMNGSTGVTIEYNVIQDNTAGIAIADAGGSINNNLIQNNNVGLNVQPSAGAGI